ncbi:MAG TPA: prepilin-type N-terminal cleavage/methylation domain-containing protein [Candidatus Synoicihabitans sp.]|nr:prepilin-type N-terminal cleavage/methylation domain-containing protein [Candidatus Synoicihabitans sp.]
MSAAGERGSGRWERRAPIALSVAAARRRRAFTLLEVVLALALVGLVLVSLNTFVFSMGELWGRNRDVRLFDQHVRAVGRFLNQELRTAALPPAVAANTAALEAREVKVEFGRSAELVTFGLREGSRLFTWPERPLPEVVASLDVRPGRGLVLYWQSALEERFGEDAPRELVLTPLATGIAYDYYSEDFERWETLPNLRKDRNGDLETPGRLRLTFRYRNLTREVLVVLPANHEGLPAY